jgi:dUTP pyrophosphatase
MSTDPASTPAPTHDPPSLPNSPLPKRTKVIDPSPLSHASTLPRGTDSGTATPTPLASTHLNMAALQPPAPIAPSIAAAASAEQQLQVLLLSDNARAPTKGSAYAAGHDLYSAKDITIPARGRALVGTDISISVPVGTCESPSYLPTYLPIYPPTHGEDRVSANGKCVIDGRVAPRSGLANKHGIDTMAGVIDADYRGPVGVILANLSDTDFDVKVGDRIAQLIVEKVE